MSSPIAFDDTQFDLDLSDHLEQFPDAPEPVATPVARRDDHAADAPEADDGPAFAGVVPVGDPWGVPADDAEPVGPVPEPLVVVVPADPVEPAEPAPEPLVVVVADEPVEAADQAEAPVYAATVVDVPVPWVPTVGGSAAEEAAVARAVDPPTSVHSVFAVTPPQGTPVVAPPPVPLAPITVAAAKVNKAARRRRRGLAVLAGVLAAGLVAGGVGLAVATDGGGGDENEAVADAPGQSVALPPAGADADKPDDAVAPPAPGDDAAPAAGDPADIDRAVDTVTTFLAVRGTDDERAVSSQGGRAELDAAVAAIGRAVPQGDPACSAGVDAGTFTCVLDTDQGPITFAVGPDADDPQTSGFEVIGASVG